MNDLEERARRLVDAARPGHDPTAADAARVRAALKGRLHAEPMLLQPGPAPAPPSGVVGKLLIALGVGSALGFAAGLYAAQAFWPGRLPRPFETGAPATGAAATNASARAGGSSELPHGVTEGRAGDGAVSARGAGDGVEAAASEAAVAPSHAATPSAESSRPASSRAPARATSSAAAPSAASAASAAVSPLKAELDGLRRAQELLYQGRPAWAIARLDELDRAGVGSVLLEERAATRAIAECRLGADGTGKADEYARRFPRSAHLERVRASCAGATQGGSSALGGGTAAQKVPPAQTESRGSQHEE